MTPRWSPGRQGTGYSKLRLGSGASWDLWLLRYPAGIGIPAHVDPVPGKRHYRVNLALWSGGSRLVCDHQCFRLGPLTVFRSDRRHLVRAGYGSRLVLSLGLVR